MQSLAQVFQYLNDVEFKYVVLRNWDGLPHYAELGEHGDLDLLVYDISHFEEILAGHLTRVYPHPRVQYRIAIGDSFVQADIRYVGDGYYPEEFENNILNTRELNPNGFWTPNPLHHRLALAYHAVHHKGYIAEDYKRWLGDAKLEEILDALKNSQIGWVAPLDYSVGKFNSYIKGATGIVSDNGQSVTKEQYRFKNRDLLSNESRILQKLNSRHFPSLVSEKDGEIEIEHCGEPLTDENMPEDWRDQLIQIVRDLKDSKVVHRDIRIENLMLKEGIIKLIDFGWACEIGSEKNDNPPDLLGFPNKAPWGYDDSFSMGKVMKQIKTKLEERLPV